MIYWDINLSVALIVIVVIPFPFQDGSQACSLLLLGFVLQGTATWRQGGGGRGRGKEVMGL